MPLQDPTVGLCRGRDPHWLIRARDRQVEIDLRADDAT
jgi:hypothetical protein